MFTNYRLLIVAFFFCSTAIAQTPRTAFSPEEVKSDLDYLYRSLVEAHYDPYLYTTEEELHAVYEDLKNSLPQDSLSLLETHKTLQQLIAAVKNGHSTLDFPAASYFAYAESGGTLFPLELAFEDGHAYVRRNLSGDAAFAPGTVITSINGTPMDEVLAGIYPYVSAERPYFKNVFIEFYTFPRYYWMAYGQQERFTITTRDEAGKTETKELAPVPVFEGFEAKRGEFYLQGLELSFPEEQVAYLIPGGFGGDESQFQRFIDSAFVAIEEQDAHTLILDLRNNTGGNDSFSDYLLAYFADKPYRWNARFSVRASTFLKDHIRANNDTTKQYFRTILDHADGERFDYDFDPYLPRPEAERFTGEVYVLVNRQSHSQAAVTAAQIQDYGFATIVGEETGEYPSLAASQFGYILPRTGLTVRSSKGFIVRVNGDESPQGVIPDIIVRDHLLDEEDEVLTELLNRINQ